MAANVQLFSGLSKILLVADSAPDYTVDGFDAVTLDASGSIDPDGVIVFYLLRFNR